MYVHYELHHYIEAIYVYCSSVAQSHMCVFSAFKNFCAKWIITNIKYHLSINCDTFYIIMEYKTVLTICQQ